jgi:hypothetical protein
MDQRFKKLYNEACKNLDLTDDILQRFAELIVLECAKVCSEQRNPTNLNYKPSEQFAEALKQHFGIY